MARGSQEQGPNGANCGTRWGQDAADRATSDTCGRGCTVGSDSDQGEEFIVGFAVTYPFNPVCELMHLPSGKAVLYVRISQ